MFPLRFLLAAGGVAALAGFAAATDKCDKRTEKMRVYPKLECRYLKSFPKPSINCGACFGYYPTQWSSWAESCGQPEVIYGPAVPDVKPVDPKVDDKKPVDPKPKDPGVDPKPIDPKKPEVAPPPPMPRVPDPVPIDPKPIDPKPVDPPKKPPETPRAMLIPVPVPQPATPVSVTVPAPAPQAPSIPLVPLLPSVNVK